MGHKNKRSRSRERSSEERYSKRLKKVEERVDDILASISSLRDLFSSKGKNCIDTKAFTDLRASPPGLIILTTPLFELALLDF
ncbi:hypothetical protein KQX54_001742 [Cotesia glomerata]|uniref:Uncharacterized protein n=1 Tax=Cotesia glomerata TaxID=32391 RepID=A0AAV7IXZ3_COTGL|nr:hypothetical protein KQX54_001742 [Cotesia glomerata]